MKLYKKILLAFAFLLIVSIIIFYPSLKRLRHTIQLFNEDLIVENFQNMYVDYHSSKIKASSKPFTIPNGKSIELPAGFVFNNRNISSSKFLDSSYTAGLLVIQHDSVLFEDYFLGIKKSTQWISWSVAKSFVSTLFGIAIDEGHIKSIEQKVEEYCPELIGSGYEGVRIKDVLQMSTGVRFNEDYGDFNSDINKWGRGFALGKSQDDFAATLVRELQPGTVNHYVSINTHVLGMIIVKATGKTLTAYSKEKLWEPLGMEYDGYWITDSENMELALGGLNATLRDYAKIGQLYLNKGKWKGKQIVSEEWVKAAVTPDAPHVMPKPNGKGINAFGYGYQWWIPNGAWGEFMALGVYNQHIYVNPAKNLVVVKISANHRFNESTNPYAWATTALAFFRAIANNLE